MFDGIYKSKRVLVTGHTGFKGSWLCEWLLRLGAEVAGFSLCIPTQPSNFEVLGLSGRLQDVRGDVRDLASLKQAFADFKPQIAFHLAAQALVRPAYEDPKATFDTNVGGAVNFLEAVRTAPTARRPKKPPLTKYTLSPRAGREHRHALSPRAGRGLGRGGVLSRTTTHEPRPISA